MLKKMMLLSFALVGVSQVSHAAEVSFAGTYKFVGQTCSSGAAMTANPNQMLKMIDGLVTLTDDLQIETKLAVEIKYSPEKKQELLKRIKTLAEKVEKLPDSEEKKKAHAELKSAYESIELYGNGIKCSSSSVGTYFANGSELQTILDTTTDCPGSTNTKNLKSSTGFAISGKLLLVGMVQSEVTGVCPKGDAVVNVYKLLPTL